MPKDYKHIFLDGNFTSEEYKIAPSFGNPLKLPKRDVASHSAKLLAQFEEIWSKKKENKRGKSRRKDFY